MKDKSWRDCIHSETLTFREERTETTCHYSKPSKVVVRPCSKFTKMGIWEGEKQYEHKFQKSSQSNGMEKRE